MRSRRAFTLVELLVVVSILALLLSLLLPSIKCAKDTWEIPGEKRRNPA